MSVTSEFASFEEAIEWLDSHIDYERVAPTRRLLPTLGGVESALGLLGNPERDFRVVHVTGTNGKGSTTAMVSALLKELGLRVGTYTSPNLHRVNERIALDGTSISDDEFRDVLQRLALVEPLLAEPLTRFELLTVGAFSYFSDEAVDVAVIEVGLGGTWDSTNVVHADVSVLTNISLDHVAVLGGTPEEIASDKAGIIKPGSMVVVGEVSDVVADIIARRADEVGAAQLWRFGTDFSASNNRLAFGGRVIDVDLPGASLRDVLVPLHGPHQGLNAAVALAAVAALMGRAPAEPVIEAAFAGVEVWGRLEVLGHRPLRMVDGAHNAAGAEALSRSLQEGFDVEGNLVVLIGMLEGRDPLDLLQPLHAAGIRYAICVAAETPRAQRPEVISAAAESIGISAVTAPSIPEGVDLALTAVGESGMVLATGSLYVAGPARQRLLERLAADV